jgi:hypothetical protein
MRASIQRRPWWRKYNRSLKLWSFFFNCNFFATKAWTSFKQSLLKFYSRVISTSTFDALNPCRIVLFEFPALQERVASPLQKAQQVVTALGNNHCFFFFARHVIYLAGGNWRLRAVFCGVKRKGNHVLWLLWNNISFSPEFAVRTVW